MAVAVGVVVAVPVSVPVRVHRDVAVSDCVTVVVTDPVGVKLRLDVFVIEGDAV